MQTTVVDKPCPHCGCWHTGACPRVKSLEYYPDGTLKRVEYHDPGQANQESDAGFPTTAEKAHEAWLHTVRW